MTQLDQAIAAGHIDNTSDIRRAKQYGMTVAEYWEMKNASEGRCATCDTDVGRTELNIDHCHLTNVVRGLLCRRCNLVIGQANDDPTLLRRMAEYLETHRQPSERTP